MYIVWLIVGIMFGGMAGIFAMWLMVAGAKCDRAVARAKREMERNGYGKRKVIRFVDHFNNSLFCIQDGDPIQMINQKGERQFCICHYLDDTFTERMVSSSSSTAPVCSMEPWLRAWEATDICSAPAETCSALETICPTVELSLWNI